MTLSSGLQLPSGLLRLPINIHDSKALYITCNVTKNKNSQTTTATTTTNFEYDYELESITDEYFLIVIQFKKQYLSRKNMDTYKENISLPNCYELQGYIMPCRDCMGPNEGIYFYRNINYKFNIICKGDYLSRDHTYRQGTINFLINTFNLPAATDYFMDCYKNCTEPRDPYIIYNMFNSNVCESAFIKIKTEGNNVPSNNSSYGKQPIPQHPLYLINTNKSGSLTKGAIAK